MELRNVCLRKDQRARLIEIYVFCSELRLIPSGKDFKSVCNVKFPDRTEQCEYAICGKQMNAYLVKPPLREGGFEHIVAFNKKEIPEMVRLRRGRAIMPVIREKSKSKKAVKAEK
jgi:hypothetical protein